MEKQENKQRYKKGDIIKDQFGNTGMIKSINSRRVRIEYLNGLVFITKVNKLKAKIYG